MWQVLLIFISMAGGQVNGVLEQTLPVRFCRFAALLIGATSSVEIGMVVEASGNPVVEK